MTNENLHERLRQFLDGELSHEQARAVLHDVADHAEARALRQFACLLGSVFEAPPHGEGSVPAGFTDRVMQALPPAATPAAPFSQRVRASLEAGWAFLLGPRPLLWRPVYALAVVVMISAGTAGLRLAAEAGPEAYRNERVQAGAEGHEVVLMRFLLVEDGASSVAVAGDFTDWKPVALHAQEVDGQTVWSGVVPVPRGEHRYMFVLDESRWVTDPLAAVQRDDGFGNRNAVLAL